MGYEFLKTNSDYIWLHTWNCSQMIEHAVCPGISITSPNIWAQTLSSTQDQPPDMPYGVTWQKTKPGAYPNSVTFMMISSQS